MKGGKSFGNADSLDSINRVREKAVQRTDRLFSLHHLFDSFLDELLHTGLLLQELVQPLVALAFAVELDHDPLYVLFLIILVVFVLFLN